MNSMGVSGAVASQLFFGRFANWRGSHGFTGLAQWDPAFYVYAGVLLAGSLGWLFIDASRSVANAADQPGS